MVRTQTSLLSNSFPTVYFFFFTLAPELDMTNFPDKDQTCAPCSRKVES